MMRLYCRYSIIVYNFKSNFLYTLSNIFKRGANYVFFLLLARAISVEELGTYSAYLNVISLLLLITNFGFNEYILVNSANSKILKSNLSLFLSVSTFIFLILLLGSMSVTPLNNLLFGLILLKVFLENVISLILLSFYQVSDTLTTLSIYNFISSAIIILLSLLMYEGGADLNSFLKVIIIIHLIVIVWNLFKIKPPIFSISFIIRSLTAKLPDLKYYGLSIITIPIYMMIPNVSASLILGNTELAIYQVAFSISNVILLISTSYIQSAYPAFLKDPKSFSQLSANLLEKVIVFNLGLIILFIYWGKSLLMVLFQKEIYVDSIYPLIGLLFANSLQSLSSIFAIALVLNKEQKTKTKFHVEFIAISIISSCLLVYYFRIGGVVITYCIIYSYTFIRYYFRSKKIKFINYN